MSVFFLTIKQSPVAVRPHARLFLRYMCGALYLVYSVQPPHIHTAVKASVAGNIELTVRNKNPILKKQNILN